MDFEFHKRWGRERLAAGHIYMYRLPSALLTGLICPKEKWRLKTYRKGLVLQMRIIII